MTEVDVAAIVGHRLKRKSDDKRQGDRSNSEKHTLNSNLTVQVQYRVRWKGFSAADDEWVDRYELIDAEEPAPSLLHRYEKRHKLNCYSAYTDSRDDADANSITTVDDSSYGITVNGSGSRGNSDTASISADEESGASDKRRHGEDEYADGNPSQDPESAYSRSCNIPVHLFSPPPNTSPPPPPPARPTHAPSSSGVALAPPPASPPPPLPPRNLQRAPSDCRPRHDEQNVGSIETRRDWWRSSPTPTNLEQGSHAWVHSPKEATVGATSAGCSADFCRQQ